MKTKRTSWLFVGLLLVTLIASSCTPQSTPVVDSPPSSGIVQTDPPAGSDPGTAGESDPGSSQGEPEGEPVSAIKPIKPATESPQITDALVDVFTPQYATGFSIVYYANGAKVLTDAGGQRTLLLPDGVSAPVDAFYDVVISGPIERAVALSTTQAGHFAQLGLVQYLKGVAVAAEKWYIPEIRAAVQSGSITNVGDDNEAIVALDPQIVFYGAAAKDVERAALLRAAGLTCIQFDDSKEDHYLGRSEWLEFVGAFFNQEAEARQIIAAGQQRVATVTNKAQSTSAHPKVLWFYYSSSGVNWNVYTNADYVSTLVQAAGGSLLVPGGLSEANQSTAVKVQDEDFLGLLQQAEIIIFGRSRASYPAAEDLTYFNTSSIDFAEAPAFQRQACYVVSNDWFQATADVAPILESLTAIIHPELFPNLTASKLTSFFPAN